MPYCKYCGSVVDSDAVFCSECGKRIATSVPPVQKGKQAEQRQEPRETSVTVRGGTIASEDVVKIDEERLEAYRQRLVRYRMAMLMANQFYNTKEEWTEHDIEMWDRIEKAMREKYEIPEISLYRFLKPERYEKVEPQQQRRRNRSYNKKDTEYWQKFEKKNDVE